MNDEEVIQTQEPVIDLPSEAEPQPDPEPTAPSVEVIPVDELLDRLSDLLNERESNPGGGSISSCRWTTPCSGKRG